MQNLPITATPPAGPAQQPVSADNNAAQPAEPFSNVLARQRTNASAPASNTGTRDSKQAAPSAAGDSSRAGGNEQAAGAQTLAPDAVATLPGKLIPGLILDRATTDTAAGSDQADPPASAPDVAAVNTLPGDMLAALLPPVPAATNSAIAGETDSLRKRAPAEAGALPADMLATMVAAPPVMRGKSATAPMQTGGSAGTTVTAAAAANTAGIADAAGRPRLSANTQDAPVLSRTQGNTGTAPLASTAVHGSSFSAALESLGKEGANTTEFSAPATPADASGNIAALAQNAAAPMASSTTGQVQAAVNTPVTHAAWGDEFGQKITWLATQHTQSAELHLNPPQLGPLDVVLKVSGDQATALFTSPHAAVRDAVEQALPRLREMLADNGIMLGNAMVSDQSAKEQQAWLASQLQNSAGNLSGKTGAAANADVSISGSTALPLRRHQGMVDTFA